MPDGNILGKMGEHNATVLDITPPEYMSANENIVLYCLAFETGRDFIKKVIRSEMIPKADVIHISLWGQVTVSENLRFQLEGYDGENNLLVKSILVECVFLPSVNGVQSLPEFGNNGISADIAANTFARHSHNNAAVLDKLGETPDGLTFNQKLIGGASARPTAQKIISNIETDENYDVDFAFWSQPHGQNLWFYVGFFYKHPDFPEGTEIADFEVKIPDLNNGEYISFKHMIPFDQQPYLSMVDKVYYDKSNNCILQQIYNFGSTLHLVLRKAEGFEWESVRITYYTD